METILSLGVQAAPVWAKPVAEAWLFMVMDLAEETQMSAAAESTERRDCM